MKEQPNTIIEVAHKEVADRVFEITDGKQFPVSENKVYGDWCFGDCQTLQLGASATESLQLDTASSDTLPAEKSSAPNWKVVGGVVLGILAAGVVLQDGDDPSSSDRDFELILQPPQ